MSAPRREVVFVGGGYRTVSFLAAQPWLLERGVEIIERSGCLGDGAFADLDCVSTSLANRFVRGVSPEVARSVADPQRLAALQHADAPPLPVREVATVMRDLGAVIAGRLAGHGNVRCGANADHIGFHDNGALVELSGGEQIACRHVVLATGRQERAHHELAAWETKTLLSADVLSISRSAIICGRLRSGCGPIVIAGGSHSAVAVLLRLLRLRAESGNPGLPLVLLRRSPVRLHYMSLAHAHAERDDAVEAPIDPAADVCPVTGQVNRDSGLRGAGRALYRDLVAGDVPSARVQTVAALGDAADLLDRATLIVQALGYQGRAPALSVDGLGTRPSDSPVPLGNLADGTGLMGSWPVPALSVLRVEPTPLAVRDHGLYGQGLYDALDRRLRGLLGAPA